MITDINLSYASGVWGLLGFIFCDFIDKCEIVKKLFKTVIVGVSLNKKIYIPRLFAPITEEVIYDEIAKNKLYDF